jgi:E3 ubiquitin-protein ligase HERC1
MHLFQVIPLECFEGSSWSGKLLPIVSGGRSIALTFANRAEYVERAIEFRLKEMDLQAAAIREGMAGIVPVPLLTLVTAQHLEQLVCGLPQISIPLLKKVVRFVLSQYFFFDPSNDDLFFFILGTEKLMKTLS